MVGTAILARRANELYQAVAINLLNNLGKLLCDTLPIWVSTNCNKQHYKKSDSTNAQ